MLEVEKVCLGLLSHLADCSDSNRVGVAIEVGAGSGDFYCEEYRGLGFQTIAVEPLANDKLRALCDAEGIELVEACIYTHDGKVDLYLGNYSGVDSPDYSSIRGDWWAADPSRKVAVPSWTLATLLRHCSVGVVTFLKLDVEGAEFDILYQLENLESHLLPKIVQFEYGGGGRKGERSAGWNDDGLARTVGSVRVLFDLGYRWGLIIGA